MLKDLTERRLSSQKVYEGKLLHVYCDRVTLPNGKEATRELIRHPGAVCVLPVNDRGEALMERQYRYPFAGVMLEAPAGKMDPGEKPLDAARRELEEETGIRPEKLLALGGFYPSVAYSDEVIWLYLAKGLRLGAAHMDEDEFLNTEFIPLKKLRDMVLSGEIADGKTQAVILKALLILEKEE